MRQFCHIKVGYKRVYIARTCYPDGIIFRSLSKKKKLEEHKKQIAETESLIATKSDLLKEVDTLLSSLGADGPPKALDLPDITGDNLVRLLQKLAYSLCIVVFSQKL